MEQTDDEPFVGNLSSAAIRLRWNDMCANLQGMEQQVLRLLAHPKSTDDQVLIARRAYAQTVRSMQETLLKLQERYPRKGKLWSPAWQFESLSGSQFIVTKEMK